MILLSEARKNLVNNRLKRFLGMFILTFDV